MSAMEQRLKRYFEKDAVIFRDGEPGQTMFIVLEGQVEISKVLGDRKTVLAELEAGSIFGEMALIDNQPRSATATATAKVTALVISRELYRSRIEDVPKWLQAFFAIIVERLRGATKNQNILLAQGAGRQVVNIIAMLAKQVEPDVQDRIILEWDKAVSQAAFLLGFDEEKVNDTFNLLVTSNVGQSDRREGLGRVFIIEDADKFHQVADFCRERYMLETGHAKEMSEPFKFADQRELELLEAIQAIVTGEGATEDFPGSTLEKYLKDKHQKPLEQYKSLMEAYAQSGVLEAFGPEGSEPTLRINNRELYDEKMVKLKLLTELGDIEKKIMA